MTEEKKVNVKKGLEGVVVDTSSVSKVMAEINSLTYRGYKVQDLAEICKFEEVAYLLLNAQLPTSAQLKNFETKERNSRSISKQLLSVISLFPKVAHPMDTLRTGISYVGMEDERIWDSDEEKNKDKAIKLLAKIPTMIAAAYRNKIGKEFIPPRMDLDLSSNFFHMCFNEVPEQEVVKAFDVSLILYAEHGFNASTFTSRVITSTMSDFYSAVVGAVGSLKGPLHGGANEQVMHVLKEIDNPQHAREWMLDAIKNKKKVMGFGHRVYKNGDSRVPTMKKYSKNLGKIKGQTKWHEISDILEQTMIDEKNIYPNLDFPAGPAYYLMGFEIEMFTPIFVMARIAGWAAHILEQTADNRIIRPLNEYVGHEERKVIPIENR